MGEIKSTEKIFNLKVWVLENWGTHISDIICNGECIGWADYKQRKIYIDENVNISVYDQYEIVCMLDEHEIEIKKL